jgi:hypothetical protein
MDKNEAIKYLMEKPGERFVTTESRVAKPVYFNGTTFVFVVFNGGIAISGIESDWSNDWYLCDSDGAPLPEAPEVPPIDLTHGMVSERELRKSLETARNEIVRRELVNVDDKADIMQRLVNETQRGNIIDGEYQKYKALYDELIPAYGRAIIERDAARAELLRYRMAGSCGTCKHIYLGDLEEPCNKCVVHTPETRYEPQEGEEI